MAFPLRVGFSKVCDFEQSRIAESRYDFRQPWKLVMTTIFTSRKARDPPFAINDIIKAYDTFGNAAKEGALKVMLTNSGTQ
jgi:threonine dehydrogenase-like Zn-dependent dehydrogenase